MRKLPAVAIPALVATAASPAPAQQPLKTAVDGTIAPHAMPELAGGIEAVHVDLANEIGRPKRPVEITATLTRATPTVGAVSEATISRPAFLLPGLRC